MNMHFINNEAQSRYELHINELMAIADYRKVDNTIYITHVETPSELKGQGVASQLMEHALKEIEQQGQKVTPICSFAVGYIQKNTQWQPLLNKGND